MADVGYQVTVNPEDTVLIPGPPGPPGPPGSGQYTIGVVNTLSPGSQAQVWLTGTSPNIDINFGIPQGIPGSGAQLSIGTVQTLGSGQPATASITGKPPILSLNICIPQATQE